MQGTEFCQQGSIDDFVEMWYTDLLATAAAGLSVKTDGSDGEQFSKPIEPLRKLLEFMRGSLQNGFCYEALIDFVCNLKESDVESRMAKVGYLTKF